MEREQETLTEKFTDYIINSAINQETQKEAISLELTNKPVIDKDESFANLASRIVEEVVATKSHKDLAKQVLDKVGIGREQSASEPHVYNGHLRHVGKRARKVARKQNESHKLRIRRVRKTSRGSPPKFRKIGAPPETRARPPLGMEDELNRSARDSSNKKGKSKRKRRLFRR